jgi:hypothetical protein
MLSHSSHLPLAIALGGFGIAVAIRYLRERRWTAPTMLIAGAILIGFAGEFAFVQVATRMLGAAPLRLPHLSAHLVEMGPGTTYLNTHCPAAQFAICADRTKFPVYWEDFLFSTAPDRGVFGLADASRKQAISSEQVRFAVAVLGNQPAAVIGGFGLSFLQQVAMFRTDEIYYTPDVLEAFATRLPAKEYRRVLRSRAAAGGGMETYLTAATYILIIASMIATAVLLTRSRRMPRPWPAAHRKVLAAAMIIAAGVAINAAVCGIIASPYDRFQARVIWLVPVIAVALWSMLQDRDAATPARSPNAGTSPAGSS